jgi:hypothetical protein
MIDQAVRYIGRLASGYAQTGRLMNRQTVEQANNCTDRLVVE